MHSLDLLRAPFKEEQTTNCVIELGLVVVLAVVFAPTAHGQSRLDAHDAEMANHLFDHGSAGGKLPCAVVQPKPFLDFSFRFVVTYELRCHVGRMKGSTRLFARVVPNVGVPVLLGQICTLPKMVGGDAEFGCDGGFWVSEGKYRVEVLAVDESGRSCQKRWTISPASSLNHQEMAYALPANTVQTWIIPFWNGKLESGGAGIRMTVLLDVVSISPNVFTLRGWDRIFLMQSLASLLQQTSCSAVRLVAFNLDQQRVIFRQDHFDKAGFQKLWQVLEHIELGSIAAHTDQGRPGWMDFLAALTNEEVTTQEPSDVVAFLGPAIFLTRKVPEEMLKPRQTSKPLFFYFQQMPYAYYYTPQRPGSEFTGSISYLTQAREGTVFKLHTPDELGLAIQKMMKQIQGSVDNRVPQSD